MTRTDVDLIIFLIWFPGKAAPVLEFSVGRSKARRYLTGVMDMRQMGSANFNENCRSHLHSAFYTCAICGRA